jgi:hypothetical protein
LRTLKRRNGAKRMVAFQLCSGAAGTAPWQSAASSAEVQWLAESALPTVLLLTMLGWTTDILDGRLARKYNKPPTWVGEQEFAFDMVMVFSGLCYLVLSGFIPFVPAIIYVMVAAAFIAYFEAPHALIWYVVWIVAALLFDWRRFSGVVREFIHNAKNLSGR